MLRQQLTRYEGRKPSVYEDSAGNPTVGVGFNLNRPDARAKLQAVGADYDAVLKGQPLSNQQIESLLNTDINTAIAGSKRVVPSFPQQPSIVQLVVANMVFNMGVQKFTQFAKFKQALEAHDYARAADEMQRSQWFHQVGRRGRELTQKVRQLAQPSSQPSQSATVANPTTVPIPQ
jgi:GH24 family phage-related lysozyme (muramidase)